MDESIIVSESTHLQAVFFADRDVGWVIGKINGEDGSIFKTTDGGDTWVTQTSVQQPLRNIQCIDSLVCIAVGDSGTALLTTNSGETWSALRTGINSDLRAGHIFSGGRKMIVVGENGLIRRSTDGGATWRTVASGSKQALTSVNFVNARTGWITGERGTLLKSTDEGGKWKSQRSGTQRALFGFSSLTNQEFVAVGTGGMIRKTANAGGAWVQQESATDAELHSVFFVNRDHGIAVGASGVARVTHNGGLTWEEYDTESEIILRDAHCPAFDFCVIVGDGGTILFLDEGIAAQQEGQDGQGQEQREEHGQQQAEQEQRQDLPDLSISSASFSTDTLTWRVANNGQAAVPRTFRFTLQWLDMDGEPVGQAVHSSASNGPAIAPGGTFNFTTDPVPANSRNGVRLSSEAREYVFSDIPAQSRRMRITLDSNEQVAESDETNNIRDDVYRPTFELSIDSLSADFDRNRATFTIRNSTLHPTSLANGRRINYSLEWLNADNVRVPSNPQNALAGFGTLDQAISANAPRTFTKNILPAPQGAAKLLLKINQGDDMRRAPEDNYEDNAREILVSR